MSNEEWWAKIEKTYRNENAKWILSDALRTVVELHKPYEAHFGDVISQVQCRDCEVKYPCPTIQAIEKELI